VEKMWVFILGKNFRNDGKATENADVSKFWLLK